MPPHLKSNCKRAGRSSIAFPSDCRDPYRCSGTIACCLEGPAGLRFMPRDSCQPICVAKQLRRSGEDFRIFGVRRGRAESLPSVRQRVRPARIFPAGSNGIGRVYLPSRYPDHFLAGDTLSWGVEASEALCVGMGSATAVRRRLRQADRGCGLQLVCDMLPAIAKHAVGGFDLDAHGKFWAFVFGVGSPVDPPRLASLNDLEGS